jgi:hypothetical protein
LSITNFKKIKNQLLVVSETFVDPINICTKYILFLKYLK